MITVQSKVQSRVVENLQRARQLSSLSPLKSRLIRQKLMIKQLSKRWMKISILSYRMITKTISILATVIIFMNLIASNTNNLMANNRYSNLPPITLTTIKRTSTSIRVKDLTLRVQTRALSSKYKLNPRSSNSHLDPLLSLQSILLQQLTLINIKSPDLIFSH